MSVGREGCGIPCQEAGQLCPGQGWALWAMPLAGGPSCVPGLTLVGAVGVGLVAVVTAVVVPITGPVHGDAAPAVALELVAGAGVAAAGLVTVVPAVVVWKGKRGRAGGQQVPGQEGAGRREDSRDPSPGEAGNNRDRTGHAGTRDVG